MTEFTQNPFNNFFESMLSQLKIFENMLVLSLSTSRMTAAVGLKPFPIIHKAKWIIETYNQMVENIKDEYHDIVFQIQELDNGSEISKQVQDLYEKSKDEYLERIHETIGKITEEAKVASIFAEAQGIPGLYVEKLKEIETFSLDKLISDFWAEEV